MTTNVAASFARSLLRKLRPDLVEHGLQFLKVKWFDQMKIESGFFGSPDIVLRAEAREGDCFDMTFCAGLRGHLVTTSIGQTDVAQHHIEMVQAHDLRRAADIIRGYDIVTEMSEQARQGCAGCPGDLPPAGSAMLWMLCLRYDHSDRSLRLPLTAYPARP